MKSIQRKYFSENILNNKQASGIQENSVTEIKIGKDFGYSLDKRADSYSVNKRLTTLVFNQVKLNDSAIAFRKERSYYDFLYPHMNNYHFLRLDVKSYFHSLRVRTIRNSLKSYFRDEKLIVENKDKLIDHVMEYCTYTIPVDSRNTTFRGKTVLPVGFPSSPVISNIIFRQIDIKIQKLCHKNHIIYTRYADDILFSSKKNCSIIHKTAFEDEISELLGRISLKINKTKTLKKSHTLSLNGNVISYGKSKGSIRLSNKKVNLINKITYWGLVRAESPEFIMDKLFNFNIDNFKFKRGRNAVFFKKVCKDQLLNKVIGYRSYLLSIIRFDKEKNCLEKRYFDKYSKIIGRLDKLIDIYS